jgi:hypothetical protein
MSFQGEPIAEIVIRMPDERPLAAQPSGAR